MARSAASSTRGFIVAMGRDVFDAVARHPGVAAPGAECKGRATAAAADKEPALGAGPALALVHGLYPGDRDGVALRDEVLRQLLRRRQGSGPGISAGQQSCRVPYREVPGRHLVQ